MFCFLGDTAQKLSQRQVMSWRYDPLINLLSQKLKSKTTWSYTDNISCLKQAMEKRTAKERELYLLFIDLENVLLVKLTKVLQWTDINPTTIIALWELFREPTTKIKIGNYIFKQFVGTKNLTLLYLSAATVHDINQIYLMIIKKM